MNEESTEWLNQATAKLGSFWDRWHGKEVEVVSGPFQGWRGVAGATYEPKVEVAFPTTVGTIERQWFNVEMLKIVTAEA